MRSWFRPIEFMFLGAVSALLKTAERDQGVARGPGGPPHFAVVY
jgi:hypothetical protein